MMIRMVRGWVFLLVPAHPGSPRERAIKRLLLLCVVILVQSATKSCCVQVQIRTSHSWTACKDRRGHLVCGRHGVVHSLTSRRPSSLWSTAQRHSSCDLREPCWATSSTTCWTCSVALQQNSVTSRECLIPTTRSAGCLRLWSTAVGIMNYRRNLPYINRCCWKTSVDFTSKLCFRKIVLTHLQFLSHVTLC